MSRIEIPPPRTLCERCALQFSPLRHAGVDDRVRGVTAYCDHNMVGALFVPKDEQWQIIGPIGEHAFRRMMNETFGHRGQEVSV